jgi:hypothetical protein
LLKDAAAKYAEDWSPDGEFLLSSVTGPSGDPDLFRYDVTADGKRFLVMAQPSRETGASVLPTLTLVQNWTAGLKK